MTRMATTREIISITRSTRDLEARAYHTRRVHVQRPAPYLPFIFIDQIGPLDLAVAQPWRARRLPCGDSWSLLYILEGEWSCCMGRGKRVSLRPGDLCWRAATGERTRFDRPSPAMLKAGGRLHCLEIILPPAATQQLPADGAVVRAVMVPETGEAARVRVLVGSVLGTTGAFSSGDALTIGDFAMSEGSSASVRVAQPQLVLLYAHQDVVWIGAHDLALREGQLAVLGPGDRVLLRGPERSLRPARVLLLAATRASLGPAETEDL